MLSLQTASKALRAAAADHGIKYGRWKPVNAGIPVDELGEYDVVAVVYNKKHPQGVEIRAYELRWIGHTI